MCLQVDLDGGERLAQLVVQLNRQASALGLLRLQHPPGHGAQFNGSFAQRGFDSGPLCDVADQANERGLSGDGGLGNGQADGEHAFVLALAFELALVANHAFLAGLGVVLQVVVMLLVMRAGHQNPDVLPHGL